MDIVQTFYDNLASQYDKAGKEYNPVEYLGLFTGAKPTNKEESHCDEFNG